MPELTFRFHWLEDNVTVSVIRVRNPVNFLHWRVPS
jgi:hypothetical protein